MSRQTGFVRHLRKTLTWKTETKTSKWEGAEIHRGRKLTTNVTVTTVKNKHRYCIHETRTKWDNGKIQEIKKGFWK